MINGYGGREVSKVYLRKDLESEGLCFYLYGK